MGKTLTPELILMRCSKTDKSGSKTIQSIKNLNMWGNDLEDISVIKQMPQIEICSLSLNKITSLKDFASCPRLTELYLRKNLVQDLLEIKHLTKCPALKVLWLWDNPIAQHPSYRQYIIKTLPNLVKLDNSAVTPEEKDTCSKMQISESDIAKGNLKTHQYSSSTVGSSEEQKSNYHSQAPSAGEGHQKQRSTSASSNSRQIVKSLKLRDKSPNTVHQSNKNGAPIQIQQNQNNAGGTNYRNENILCAVLALLKELDEGSLELVQRDIDRKLNNISESKK